MPTSKSKTRYRPRRKSAELRVGKVDLKTLRESGLTDSTIRANALYTDDNAVRLSGILNIGEGSEACEGGLVIPYRDHDGALNGFARVRPHHGKRKYMQPKGEPPRAFFPHDSITPLKKSGKIVIVEGEKKALMVSKIDSSLAVIGLPGVNTGVVDGILNEYLRKVTWRDREVVILFDTDPKPATRHNVRKARETLASHLGEQGAEVFFVALPAREDGKNAIDEHLKSFGVNAKDELHALLETAEPIHTGARNTLIDLHGWLIDAPKP